MSKDKIGRNLPPRSDKQRHYDKVRTVLGGLYLARGCLSNFSYLPNTTDGEKDAIKRMHAGISKIISNIKIREYPNTFLLDRRGEVIHVQNVIALNKVNPNYRGECI